MRVLGCLLAVVLVVLVSACGESKCEKTYNKLCEKACACPSTDGKCRISIITFDTEDDCKALFNYGCSMDDGSVDFDACSQALDTAMCVDDGSGNQSLESPPECDSNPPPSDAGPR